MKVRVQAFNSTYRRGLTITVMDEIRRQFAKGTEVTNRSLFSAIRERTAESERNRLMDRIGTCVRDLELSGHITRQRVQPEGEQLPYKTITPTNP